jgi:hypothetical protein
MTSRLIILLPLLVLLTACPGNYEPSSRIIRKNNMDLPDLEKRAHDGISFKLSSLFEDSYYSDYILSKNATTKTIMDLHLHFSVETFTSSDLETLRFLGESNQNDGLLTIHEHYIDTRMASLDQRKRSVRKKVSKKVGFPGYTTVIDGKNEYDEKLATYFISTIEIDGKYHVFQMIGNQDKMGYFFDDYREILNSIEK